MICKACARGADLLDMAYHNLCKGCDCQHQPNEEWLMKREKLRATVQEALAKRGRRGDTDDM